MLWLHKCFAAYLGCNEGLFQSKLLFYPLESVGLFSSVQDCLDQDHNPKCIEVTVLR